MRELDLEGHKKIQLEILDVVDKFCKEHDINYVLIGGTLIGAIRHKGYIPWDDDIDLVMLRPDYDKFLELFNKYNTRYRFECIENQPDFPRYWGRVSDTNTLLVDVEAKWDTHIYADIFCWDNAPDDDKALRKMLLRKFIYRRLYLLQFFPVMQNSPNIIKRLCKIILSALIHMIPAFILPKNYFAAKMVQNAKIYAHENTKRLGNFLGPQQTVVSREAFADFVDHEFEGKMYKIPSGYDEILRGLYGDYMQLPPEEERVTHHFFRAYVKDENGE